MSFGKLFDLHDNCQVANALDSQTISTDTTTNGEIIDTKGFHGLEFILKSAAVTDGAYAVTLTHGDDSGLSDGVTVNVADLLGSIDFVAADDNVAKRIGYIGKKRYARLNVVSTGTSSGAVLDGVAVQFSPFHAPVANQ
tara:strand:- start:3201 stop:3617 length:417 start_codon:yes stop_codon:yes gene_type:complete